MKKLIAIVLCILALFALSACATQDEVEAARSSAYQRGYDDGYAEGRSDGLAEGRREARSEVSFRLDDCFLIEQEDYEYACSVIDQLYEILEENWDRGYFSVEEFYGYLSNYSLPVMELN